MERIQAIRLFVRVVELGSFSKAAVELGIGQPAATKQVARMEKQLGVRLLNRTTRGVAPTEIGLRYLDSCRLIVHHLNEAEAVGTLLQTQAQGSLRISTSVAFGRRVLAPLVLRFMREHPQLQVDLGCEDRYVNLVEQGVDVAVRMGRLPDSTLGSRYLGLNPWVLVAAPGYFKPAAKSAVKPHSSESGPQRSARTPPRSPHELQTLDALIYSTVQGDARWHFTGPAGQLESVVVRGALRSNNLSSLLLAATQGFGVAALPRYVAAPALTRGALIPLLESWQLPQQEIHAVFPSPRLLTTKVTLFIDWLQQHLADGWWAGR